MRRVRIAIIDRNPHTCPEDHRGRLMRLLTNCPTVDILDVPSVADLSSVMPRLSPDVILLRSAASEDAEQLLGLLQGRARTIPILGLFCASEDTPTASYQTLLKECHDFLTCPFRNPDVFLRLSQLLPRQQEMSPTSWTPEMQERLRRVGLVGESAPFLQLLDQVLRVTHTDATILLWGETGTGKELVAQAIHYCSPRRGSPFIPVNCGALPDHLVENELFGHAKGAYTDASSPEKGLVAEAEGGTLFLDEVDTLSAPAQVKLLRFLQDRVYRPVGSAKSITANVRIIAATNANLWQLVQTKRFREDLYYRLHVVAFRMPPLRERPDDIPRLASHFLQRYGTQYSSKPQSFSTHALHKLIAYPWPGNIRELETVIQRAVLLTSTPILCPDDLELSLPSPGDVTPDGSFRQAKIRIIEQFERTYLTNLLTAHAGNISRAAKHAGKERRAFTRLLQKYDLHRQSFQT